MVGRSNGAPVPAWYRRWRQTNRTTRMLVAVVTLFLVTELPHSAANIMSGLSDRLLDGIYFNLGDLIDILALVNNGVNFVLYCTMSRQFRKTFVELATSSTQRRHSCCGSCCHGNRCCSRQRRRMAADRSNGGGDDGGGGRGGESVPVGVLVTELRGSAIVQKT